MLSFYLKKSCDNNICMYLLSSLWQNLLGRLTFFQQVFGRDQGDRLSDVYRWAIVCYCCKTCPPSRKYEEVCLVDGRTATLDFDWYQRQPIDNSKHPALAWHSFQAHSEECSMAEFDEGVNGDAELVACYFFGPGPFVYACNAKKTLSEDNLPECLICLDVWRENWTQFRQILPCGHHFCKRCLVHLHEFGNANICPYCLQAVKRTNWLLHSVNRADQNSLD